jgi:hypothetical protein
MIGTALHATTIPSNAATTLIRTNADRSVNRPMRIAATAASAKMRAGYQRGQ